MIVGREEMCCWSLGKKGFAGLYVCLSLFLLKELPPQNDPDDTGTDQLAEIIDEVEVFSKLGKPRRNHGTGRRRNGMCEYTSSCSILTENKRSTRKDLYGE